MSLRVVMMTRSGRPSGAQMAWRLIQAGYHPLHVIVEGRGRMIHSKKKGLKSFLGLWGIEFLGKKILEALEIKSQFWLRRTFGKKYKNPVYLSIEELALDYPVKIHEVDDHNSAQTAEILRGLSADIGILTNTRRIKKEILEIPRHGFLNLHLSLLPKYAGLESIFWALLHDEKEIGATVHFADEQIDRGDIILQQSLQVFPFDDEDSLYHKALWVGTGLMVTVLMKFEEGCVEKRPQSGDGASYFSWPKPAERRRLRERLGKRKALPRGPSQKVRVLHVITRMIRGGAQKNTLSTVLGLQEKGYEVTLVTGPSWGHEEEVLSEAFQQGVNILIIPELVREINPFKDLIVLQKLSSLMEKCSFDMIHTHTSKAGILGRLAAFKSKCPMVIHTPHGHVFHSYFSGWKEGIFIWLERQMARRTDRLIALTVKCRNEHLEFEVGGPRQWAVIPSGIDEKSLTDYSRDRDQILNELKIPPWRKIIGFIGRFAPVKGPYYLAGALPYIYWEKLDFHCIFVGDGEGQLELRQFVAGSGIHGRVTFTGYQKNISRFLSVFDILVVPSLNEGMGRTIVEAGFLKKPVVATRVGGIPDLIEDGVTGLLVTARSSSEIAFQVTRLLRDERLAKKLGEALYEKVRQHFTASSMIEQIHQLYQDVRREKGFSSGIKGELPQVPEIPVSQVFS